MTHLMLLAGLSTTHTAHQPALVRATTHLLLGKTIITQVNWTLQTSHTVHRNDTDAYLVTHRWSKTFIKDIYTIIITAIHCKQITFALRHYSSEVGEYIIFWCEISSGYYTPKIIENDSVFTELFKILKLGRFIETQCIPRKRYKIGA